MRQRTTFLNILIIALIFIVAAIVIISGTNIPQGKTLNYILVVVVLVGAVVFAWRRGR